MPAHSDAATELANLADLADLDGDAITGADGDAITGPDSLVLMYRSGRQLEAFCAIGYTVRYL